MHLVSQINGLLKRCYKYGYCLKINTVEGSVILVIEIILVIVTVSFCLIISVII